MKWAKTNLSSAAAAAAEITARASETNVLKSMLRGRGQCIGLEDDGGKDTGLFSLQLI